MCNTNPFGPITTPQFSTGANWYPTVISTTGYLQNLEVLEQAVGSDVALVKLRVNIPGVISIDVEGSAKRDPIDPVNDETALNLAYARALNKVVRKLNKRAWGNIKHADDMRDDKARRRQKDNQDNLPFGALAKIHENAMQKLADQGKLFH